MRKETIRAVSRLDRELPYSDGDGNRIHNEILLSLSADESRVVYPKLELIRLRPRQVLHEVGDTLKSAYFCNSGMISILSVSPTEKVLRSP